MREINPRAIMIFKQAERDDRILEEIKRIESLIDRKLTTEEISAFRLGYTTGERIGRMESRRML